jgi:cold shock CspA family protein
MLDGIITQLLPARRLGFVRPTGGGVPLLFAALAVEGVHFAELVEGQVVTYTLEKDRLGRGPRATHVRPIDCPLGEEPADDSSTPSAEPASTEAPPP